MRAEVDGNGNVYETVDWIILRETVLDRDGHKCYVCGCRATVAHHLTYAYGVLCNPRWLISLCWNCHVKIYWKRERIER